MTAARYNEDMDHPEANKAVAPIGPPPTGRVLAPGESYFGYTKAEWDAKIAECGPATSDDCTILADGRRLDSREKVLAWIEELNGEGTASSVPVEEHGRARY